jgi:hypothetical protein
MTIEYLIELEEKLDGELGYAFWKRYVKAGFWSYISMPINLAITMLTAVTTGQAATSSLLPQSIYLNISIGTLILTVLNTYFKPREQLAQSTESLKKWYILGVRFENVYYSEKDTDEDIKNRIIDYKKIKNDVNELRKNDTFENQNFFTDCLHELLLSSIFCLKKENHWLKLDTDIKNDFKVKNTYHPPEIINSRRSNDIIPPNNV